MATIDLRTKRSQITREASDKTTTRLYEFLQMMTRSSARKFDLKTAHVKVRTELCNHYTFIIIPSQNSESSTNM